MAPVSKKAPPNKSSCPTACALENCSAALHAAGIALSKVARVPGKSSRAPALTRVSITLLLQRLRSTRLQKSWKLLKTPLDWRASTILSIAPSPTPFKAPRP